MSTEIRIRPEGTGALSGLIALIEGTAGAPPALVDAIRAASARVDAVWVDTEESRWRVRVRAGLQVEEGHRRELERCLVSAIPEVQSATVEWLVASDGAPKGGRAPAPGRPEVEQPRAPEPPPPSAPEGAPAAERLSERASDLSAPPDGGGRAGEAHSGEAPSEDGRPEERPSASTAPEPDSDEAYMAAILKWAREATTLAEPIDRAPKGTGAAPQGRSAGTSAAAGGRPERRATNGRGGGGTKRGGPGAFGKKQTAGPRGPGVLYGEAIDEEPVALSTVTAERERVVVEGAVRSVSARPIRGERELITFELSDRTDSIEAKLFVSADEELASRLDATDWVKVSGSVEPDRYSRELTLQVRHMVAARAPERKDGADEPRVELHLHTKMSAMDGTCDIDEVFAQAARWGHPAVAVTDHGVVQAFPDAHEASKRHGVKLIYGMEGYLVEEDKPKFPMHHIIFLVKDLVGLKNLYKLVSQSHLHHFYRKPRIPRKELAELRDGIFVGSACEAGELFRAIVAGETRDRLKQIASFYDYLEIQPLGNNAFMLNDGTVASKEELAEFNKQIVSLADELGLPVVATGDVHFLRPEDEVYRRILMAGQGFSDAERQAPLYLRTTDEMFEEFSYLDEATARRAVVDTPRALAEMVGEFPPRPEGFFPFKMPNADDLVAETSRSRAREWYGDPLPGLVAERLGRELKAIVGNGYASLYWAAHKLVTRSLSDGYLVGSRGSVGSSLVATLCGITEVNPLPPHYRCSQCKRSEFFDDGRAAAGVDLPPKACPGCGEPMQRDGFDIPFETFMGFTGEKVPDIDLNFSGEYQGRIHAYAEELFGREAIYRAGTIGTLADRTAFGFVKKYLDTKGQTLRNAEINRLVSGIGGVRRTTGQHPGGLLVVPSDREIYEFTPIQYPANDRVSGVVTTHFDFHSIHDQLVKLDLLGHDDPTMLRVLQEFTGVDPREVPLDDPETMRIFSDVEALGISPDDVGGMVGTIAVPEFGTRFVRQMLEETRPKNFGELVRISGFSHGTNVWLNNARDLIQEEKASLTDAISTRDDIMLFLIRKGLEPSDAFAIGERVRKGKGLRDEDRENMRAAGVADWYIESCEKISYLFPKAHAVAYVTMAFRIAYYKVHYPAAFYAAYFQIRADEFDATLVCRGEAALRETIREVDAKGNDATQKERNVATIAEVAVEALARGIEFRKVDLYESDPVRFHITDDGLLPPLVALQGLGEAAANAIDQARKEAPFTSLDDLKKRGKATKTVIEILKDHGALDGLPETDQLSLFG